MKTETLTREQRRIKERVNKEVSTTLARLTLKFYEFFMDNDPSGKELLDKQKELSTKWKMYCHRMNLIDEALPLFDKNADKILDDYKKQSEVA